MSEIPAPGTADETHRADHGTDPARGTLPADGFRMFSPVAMVASCVGFALIGALQSLYGPAIPALRDGFGLTPSAAGLGLSAHFIGGVCGVLAFNRVHGRVGNRALLGVSYLLMAVGTLGFAFAPAWPPALAAALVAGLGFGGIDYGLNQLFAVGFGKKSTAMLNVLNAFFGIGAVGGPAIIGAVGPGRYPWVFGVFGVLCAALLLFLKGVSNTDPPRAEEAGGPAGPARSPVGRSLVLLMAAFITLYVLHVGVEAGVGGWEPTHLETVGFSAAFAASATSVYWLMMTVGRFLVVPLTLRWSEPTIVKVSCAGMAVCLALASVPALAPYMYAGVGLFIAPIFPTGLPWLTRAAPAARRAGAYVIAASMVGGVAAGPALGGVIQVFDVHAVPVVLCAVSVVCLVVSVAIHRAHPGASAKTLDAA